MRLPRPRRRTMHPDLTPVEDSHPKDGLFTQPIVVAALTAADPEPQDDGQVRVASAPPSRTPKDGGAPTWSSTPRCRTPNARRRDRATTDLMGAVRFRMTGPVGHLPDRDRRRGCRRPDVGPRGPASPRHRRRLTPVSVASPTSASISSPSTSTSTIGISRAGQPEICTSRVERITSATSDEGLRAPVFPTAVDRTSSSKTASTAPTVMAARNATLDRRRVAMLTPHRMPRTIRRPARARDGCPCRCRPRGPRLVLGCG